VSDPQRRYIRSCECIKPQGPLSRADFYRRVERGDIRLHHIGRMSFVEFASADDLLADLMTKDAARSPEHA